MRDPTPLPPASAIHRVGMSLLEKNVLSLSSGGAGVLLRGVSHQTRSSTALLEEAALFGTEHGEFHPMGII